jgi:uncharacterized membrane protein YdbT with pleckstrin-like domain
MEQNSADQQHRASAAERLSPIGRKFFQFVEFDANEDLVAEIRKHPFGLFLVLFIGLFVMLAIVAITTVVLAVDLNQAFGVGDLNGFKPILLVVAFFISVGVTIMTLIAAWLYKNNVIFVTTEKIAQVLYVSLFNRKISQLSIGDVQDVTVTQKGIVAHLFHYGTLVIETAGEQQNYTFTYVPRPYETSQQIVGAHERNLTKYGN